jgi:hypothetical protein
MSESTFQTFVSLVRALAWPLLIVLVAFQFNDSIRKLLDRINSAGIKVPGGEAQLTFEAIVQSGNQNIAQQVTPVTLTSPTQLPVSSIEEAAKGGVQAIPQLIQRQIQALDFTLGAGSYNAAAITAHFDALIPYSFFRYVIFLRPDQTFFGMVDARTLYALLRTANSGWTYSNFADAVNTGNDTRLAQLPGFVPAGDSVKAQDQKREALERMENTGR